MLGLSRMPKHAIRASDFQMTEISIDRLALRHMATGRFMVVSAETAFIDRI